MKNTALKTAGVFFAFLAVVQAVRFFKHVTIVAGGTTQIPLWVSAIAAVITLLLAVWMFSAARAKN